MATFRRNNTPHLAILGVFAAIALWLVFKGLSTAAIGFYPDIAIHIVILITLYFFRGTLQMTPVTYALVVASMLLHDFGILGFYGDSPLPLRWDTVTHLAGGFAAAFLFFGFFKQWMTPKPKSKKYWLLATVFFAAFGAGALVEANEFWGYLRLGFGEGTFYFGTGDTWPGTGSDVDNINVVGGGWINTGYDLTYNVIGILLGITASLLAELANAYWRVRKTRLRKRKKKRN